MALSETAIKTAKPGEKPRKLSDEKGLYLLLRPNGGRWWRFDYRFAGKRRTISFGIYPDVSLKAARALRDEARSMVASGVDPSEQRKTEKAAATIAAANSFEDVAREWFARQKPNWAASHAEKVIQRLERDVFPWIGSRPISELSPLEMLSVVRRVEARGAKDTSHRVMQNIGQIMRFAVATGRADSDPTRDLRDALPPLKHKHFASVTEPAEVGAMLRAFDGFTGTFQVKCALLLGPLLFVRPGELRNARWSEFDLEAAQWLIPAERMKSRKDHVVPLPKQAVAILRDLYPLSGHREFVFPGRSPKKPMSGAAINAALRRLGFDTVNEITGHGFRAMARTMLHEQLHFAPEIIEHQLAHRVADSLGSAYNRTKFLKERRKMMQVWADYLDQIKVSGEVVPFPGTRVQEQA
ncbi:tyrosine-type recombinase/integrase [Castellaniella daejeonensis]|uniref:Tyrosine-type recombinase/integrase n=1 Tax=Castellaniella daejeonensis TaxID=659013 RepID=A0ABP3CYL9_9BURK